MTERYHPTPTQFIPTAYKSTEEALKEEKISKIKDDLMSAENLPPCVNANYLIEMGLLLGQNLNLNQTQPKPIVRPQHGLHGNAPIMQQQVRMIPEPVPQDPALNLENLVNNMSLETLCSQDEDLDT